MSNVNKYLINPDLKPQVKQWISSNLANYLAKHEHEENQVEIEHIIDYLNSEQAPVRLVRMSYNEARNNAKKWTELLQKRGASFQEGETDVKNFIKFKSGYRFVQLISKEAFEREGSLMRHCVASYHNKSGTKVYSLRDALNNPHCTIEVVGDNNIQQIKGKGNGSIHPDYISKVLVFLKKVGMNVRDSELENLGYKDLDSVSAGFTKFILEKTKGAKFKTIGGKRYFYVNSKLVANK